MSDLEITRAEQVEEMTTMVEPAEHGTTTEQKTLGSQETCGGSEDHWRSGGHGGAETQKASLYVTKQVWTASMAMTEEAWMAFKVIRQHDMKNNQLKYFLSLIFWGSRGLNDRALEL